MCDLQYIPYSLLDKFMEMLTLLTSTSCEVLLGPINLRIKAASEIMGLRGHRTTTIEGEHEQEKRDLRAFRKIGLRCMRDVPSEYKHNRLVKAGPRRSILQLLSKIINERGFTPQVIR